MKLFRQKQEIKKTDFQQEQERRLQELTANYQNIMKRVNESYNIEHLLK